MDKYCLEQYDSEAYSIKQLNQLKADLQSDIQSAARKLFEVDKIICGLQNNHKWQLVEFDNNTFPYCNPPGVFIFRCKNCDEKIVLKACNRKKWAKEFEELVKNYGRKSG